MDEIVFGKDKSKVIDSNGNVEAWHHPVVVTASRSSRMKLFSEKLIARNDNVEVWQHPVVVTSSRFSWMKMFSEKIKVN